MSTLERERTAEGNITTIRRTHCYCGTKMPDDPQPHKGDWGDWYCPKCGRAYCQDCGDELDYNDECPRYQEATHE